MRTGRENRGDSMRTLAKDSSVQVGRWGHLRPPFNGGSVLGISCTLNYDKFVSGWFIEKR